MTPVQFTNWLNAIYKVIHQNGAYKHGLTMGTCPVYRCSRYSSDRHANTPFCIHVRRCGGRFWTDSTGHHHQSDLIFTDISVHKLNRFLELLRTNVQENQSKSFELTQQIKNICPLRPLTILEKDR